MKLTTPVNGVRRLRIIRCCFCSAWIANAPDPFHNAAEVTCPGCRRYGPIWAFFLGSEDHLRERAPTKEERSETHVP